MCMLSSSAYCLLGVLLISPTIVMLESVYQNYYMYPEGSNTAPTYDAAPPPSSLGSITPQPPSSQQQQLPSPTPSIILGTGNYSNTSPWSSSTMTMSSNTVSCGSNNNNKGHSTCLGDAADTFQQHPSTGKVKSSIGRSSCRFALRHNRLSTTTWEEEKTSCYMVDAKGICVTRRAGIVTKNQPSGIVKRRGCVCVCIFFCMISSLFHTHFVDNNMVNGTKLLNVVGISRGKRDGILKNAKGRVVVKVGPMSLKGVW